MSNLLVDIQALNISFGGKHVLKNFDFSIAKGEIVSVVGESGSGKSISALMSMGLLAPSAGVVNKQALLFGQELESYTKKEWCQLRGKRIAMIFQDPMTALHPSMRVGKQLEEVLIQHTTLSSKERKKIILSALTEVELPSPETSQFKYPHELSGGQRQRVVIAMAMLLEPELIIADEPTTALDKEVEATVLALLEKLVRTKGCALWFISHDLKVVSDFSDKVQVLYMGETVESGSAKQVFKNPQHPYTKGLLACRPPKQGRPYPLPVLSDFMERYGPPKQQELESPLGALNVLSIQGLNLGYKIKRGLKTTMDWVIKDLDLKLLKGETLGLTGPSGSGKSSIGRAIVGLNDYSCESFDYEGHPLKIQFIFQDPFSALNGSHSIGRILGAVLKKHQGELSTEERQNRAGELLEEVGLAVEDIVKKPAAFSGGQRQRIGIARALAANPTVLICDESVSALDVSVQAQVLNLLNGIKKNRDLSMIFISHDPDVIRYMCDRVVTLTAKR